MIPWSLPVPVFGDPELATVATVGLNPSNCEFVDRNGNELSASNRRFHTLGSLGLKSWSDATPHQLTEAAACCSCYFERNPYSAWFGQLDRILSHTQASYYRSLVSRYLACHLDLVPFATWQKWGQLSPRKQAALIDSGGDVLGQLLRDSSIKIIVLNGASVVRHFQTLADVILESNAVPDWCLSRGQFGSVQGISYRGSIREFGGVSLGRQVLVLGYNHNIQSTYGVTQSIRLSIGEWIAQQSVGVIL